MELRGASVVVTGGASGIGRALCRRFSDEGASVVVADVDEAGAEETAEAARAAGGRAVAQRCDVRREADAHTVVRLAEERHGPVDLFCANAGIAVGGGADAPDEDWQRAWDVNVLGQVHAARAVLPSMLARGEGYFLATASAAGLLTNLGAAPYSVTKHAVVALAEWLAITHGDAGLKVSCLCPQGVRTPMLMGGLDQTAGAVVLAGGGLLEPEQVADAVVEGLADERFLILPHPEVLDYFRGKADDYDRWLGGMRRLQRRLGGGAGPSSPRT